MKSEKDRDNYFVKTSPPSRGAWIEIALYLRAVCRCVVAPLAGGVD